MRRQTASRPTNTTSTRAETRTEPTDRLIGDREIAEILGVSAGMARKLRTPRERGGHAALTTVTVGRCARVLRSEVLALLSRREIA